MIGDKFELSERLVWGVGLDNRPDRHRITGTMAGPMQCCIGLGKASIPWPWPLTVGDEGKMSRLDGDLVAVQVQLQISVSGKLGDMKNGRVRSGF